MKYLPEELRKEYDFFTKNILLKDYFEHEINIILNAYV